MPLSQTPPARIIAGDTIDFTWSHPDHPASAGWTTAWRLIGAGIAGLPLALSASASGNAFQVTALAAATAAVAVPARGASAVLAGWAMLSAQRFEVFRAPVQLLPDPATITGDLRGHAARTLAAIEALLEGRASKDQMSYRIGDRELSRIPIAELLQLRDYYSREAKREADAMALASGLPRRSPRMILSRMGRA